MKALLVILSCVLSVAFAASPPAAQRNFVTCPIVRDTQTVPCWLAEYEGELYYLGIQTDSSAEWQPPYLGHRVLVEGALSDDGRICGGVVLKPVVTSALPELDAECNAPILPAQENYTVPFAPRGPGPSKGNLAFANTRPDQSQQPSPPSVTKSFIVRYEFDWPWVTRRTARVVQQAVDYAKAIKASRIEIVGYRGATLLSDGTTFVEKTGIAERRAKRVLELLTAVGIDATTIETRWQDQADSANGVADFESRRVSIVVKP